MQKHILMHFLNNRKLLIKFIDVIVGKSLVKHIYIRLSFIDHSFEKRRKISKRKQRKGGIIDIKLI